MIDRTTQETPAGSGVEGLVYGGRPIRAQEIAHELQMAPRTVQTHLNQLVSAGYLRRIDHASGSAAGYAVLKSKKWRPKLSVVGGKGKIEKPEVAVDGDAEFCAPPLISADPAPISALPPPISAQGAPISAALYRNNTQTIHRLNIVEDFSLTAEPAPKKLKNEILKSLVEAGWQYFLERVGKSPSQYKFSQNREKLGLKGFQSLVSFAKERRANDPEKAATELFRVAVDRLADSPFHNGQNSQRQKYLDWHQLFQGKGYESTNKLIEFWLDDARWPA